MFFNLASKARHTPARHASRRAPAPCGGVICARSRLPPTQTLEQRVVLASICVKSVPKLLALGSKPDLLVLPARSMHQPLGAAMPKFKNQAPVPKVSPRSMCVSSELGEKLRRRRSRANALPSKESDHQSGSAQSAMLAREQACYIRCVAN
eukprot:2994718-Amphidinium_carterae.3